MVEYFGEQLKGFTFTSSGWVQSYGSRCVKPPIIFGDVSRPESMTVQWSKFAQDQTKKIVKGMLTGPITILQWSFVRDDQPRSASCAQLALAIREEVLDLEKAGNSDDLNDSIDYNDVAILINNEIVGPPVTLIEALAENISTKILKAYPTVEKVKTTVHKPRAPISVAFGDVSVTIKRER